MGIPTPALPRRRSSNSEHNMLVRQARRGGPSANAAKEQVLAAYMPLLASAVSHALARFHGDQQHLTPDAWQGAYLGFLDGLTRFDPDRGTNFGAFASKYVRGGIRQSISGSIDLRGVPLGSDLEIEDERPLIAEVLDHEGLASVREFVASLPPRQRRVIELMYWDGLSQAEAARTLGVSRAAVNALHSKVISRGRSSAELAAVADSLE